jgi:hypothetical protein
VNSTVIKVRPAGGEDIAEVAEVHIQARNAY